MQTVIHAYSFDMTTASGRAAYRELCERLMAQGLRKFYTISNGKTHHGMAAPISGQAIELETAHLFDNQWNTGPTANSANGLRVFDWAEDARYVNGREVTTVRTGHYLEQTDEMRAARASRVACGYCGKQYDASEPQEIAGFCGACCDSPYLKESDLRLTRLRPVTAGIRYESPPLTAEEFAAVVPRFTAAQVRGRAVRDAKEEAKQRAKVAAIVDEARQAADKKIAAARRKQEGFQFLLDRGLWGILDNVIYYDHCDKFHFGWRSEKEGLSDSVVAQLLDVISEFPAPYEISTDPKGVHGGRKLSGGEGC